MGDLIVLPESDALKAEIETLRAELSALFAQRDELVFVVCKNIETEYMLKIGGLEHRAYSETILTRDHLLKAACHGNEFWLVMPKPNFFEKCGIIYTEREKKTEKELLFTCYHIPFLQKSQAKCFQNRILRSEKTDLKSRISSSVMRSVNRMPI